MNKQLNDSELNLKVAGILSPECEWVHSNDYGAVAQADQSDGIGEYHFDFESLEGIGEMCIWLARNTASNGSVNIDEILKNNLSNPHRAIAEAIVETKGEDNGLGN